MDRIVRANSPFLAFFALFGPIWFWSCSTPFLALCSLLPVAHLHEHSHIPVDAVAGTTPSLTYLLPTYYLPTTYLLPTNYYYYYYY